MRTGQVIKLSQMMSILLHHWQHIPQFFQATFRDHRTPALAQNGWDE
jgi:hypothetical protein